MKINKKIEEYFRNVKDRDFVKLGRYIHSVDAVLEILRYRVVEGIDNWTESALYLLQASDSVIIPTLESGLVNNEEELELLLITLSFCKSEDPKEEFNLLKKLILLYKESSIGMKISLIEALYSLHERVERIELIKQLESYLDDEQKVRSYAQEIISKLKDMI